MLSTILLCYVWGRFRLRISYANGPRTKPSEGEHAMSKQKQRLMLMAIGILAANIWFADVVKAGGADEATTRFTRMRISVGERSRQHADLHSQDVESGVVDEATIGFTRTQTLATNALTYHASWNCQGSGMRYVLIKRPHRLPETIWNVLRLGSIQYQTEEINGATFRKEFRAGHHEIEAFLSSGGHSVAELDLDYDQFPGFIIPTNLKDGATEVTFPFTITWEPVDADWIYIDVQTDSLEAGAGADGNATSYEFDSWLFMPGERYTVTFIAGKNIAGGIYGNNTLESVTVLKFRSAGKTQQ
jgi:hypothetical protein